MKTPPTQHIARVASALWMMAAGCGTGNGSTVSVPAVVAPRPQLQPPAPVDPCRASTENTQISVEDTQGGVAVVYTTKGDVAELRHNIHHLADVHKTHSSRQNSATRSRASNESGTIEPGQNRQFSLNLSKAYAEDVEGGARIVLTPKDPSRVAELRATARELTVTEMASGQCPFYQDHD